MAENPIIDIVSDAIAAVGDALPAQNKTLSLDGTSAPVSLLSSVDCASAPVESDAPQEALRVVAAVKDFPVLEPESLVELDGEPRLITRLSRTGEAAWFIGLSDALSNYPAQYQAFRRAAPRQQMAFPLPILAAQADAMQDFPSAAAPALRTVWRVVVRRDDWPETFDPAPGDTILFYATGEGREKSLALQSVTPRRGYFALKCRER